MLVKMCCSYSPVTEAGHASCSYCHGMFCAIEETETSVAIILACVCCWCATMLAMLYAQQSAFSRGYSHVEKAA